MGKGIKYVCCKCESENVEIMSAIERSINTGRNKIPTVDLKYICKDCGNVEVSNEFLYKKSVQICKSN